MVLIKMISAYSHNRKQRTRKDQAFYDPLNILSVYRKEQYQDLLIYNIANLSFTNTFNEFFSYVDNTNLYGCRQNFIEIIYFESSCLEEILGNKTDSRHIASLSFKTNKRLSALAKLSKCKGVYRKATGITVLFH